MEPPYSEVWLVVEHSLDCAARARRLTEDASLLREMSERLRQQSADLVRVNRMSRTELHLQAAPTQSQTVFEK